MEKTPSQEKAKMQSQDTTLDDYSSDSSLTNHQLKFNLLRLTSQKQQVERGMIIKEADIFTTDDSQMDDVNTNKIKIQLKDSVPV